MLVSLSNFVFKNVAQASQVRNLRSPLFQINLGYSAAFSAEQTNEVLESVNNRDIHPISLKEFTEFGSTPSIEREKLAFNFLRMELPARLGNIIAEFDEIPCNLLSMPSAKRVRKLYTDSLHDLFLFHPSNPESINVEKLNVDLLAGHLQNFRNILKRILDRHAPTETLLAQGVRKLILSQHGSLDTLDQLQYFLDRFYMSRIGIRMQMRQHIELYENDANTPPSVIGTIDKFCNVASILKAAGSTAQTLCRSHYGMAPDFKVSTVTNSPEPITLAYPPSHLFHIGFELLKNSMRAVVEFHSKKTDDLPPVDVALSQGEEDITIKISDAGGGIPKSQINNIWTYLFTTAESPNLDEDFSADVYHAPIAGFGYGLPLTRLYARYFGGDLNLVSMEGYGTDALVYLKRKMSEAREVLPRLDSASVGNYNPTNSEDWMVSQIYPRRTLPLYG